MRRIGLLVAVVLATAAAASGARTTSDQGLIAFTRYRFQNSPLWSEIWVVRPDGSGALRVSHSAKPVEDDGAHFSPDGRWIVFDRCPANGSCSVWRVHPDGSAQRRLPVACPAAPCNDSGVSVTPDGRHLLLAQDWGRLRHGTIAENDQTEHSAIVETALDGSSRRVVRQRDLWKGGYEAPRLSPDGKILIAREYVWHPGRITPYRLMVHDVSGGPPSGIAVPGVQPSGGEFSPDGQHVLFRSTSPGDELTPGNAIYVADLHQPPNGNRTGIHRVTRPTPVTYYLTGSFSPDGTKIVYASGTTGLLADIYTLDLATGARVHVTSTHNLDGWPSWGPSS